MNDLLENGDFLLINYEILKVLSWILGAYFTAWGLMRFRKGWIKQDKKELFKANLALLLGLLFILFFLKSIIWR